MATDAAFDAVVARLAAAGCVAPRAEATALVRAATARGDDVDVLLCRRERGEPLAWITGEVMFCDHTVRVDAGVYVPRPQTEDLARRAARRVPLGGRALDVCTGSGAIAVHLQASDRDATVIGVDIDPAAVMCARRNGVAAVRADLDLPFRTDAFDVIVAVAPYVPTSALHLLPADVQRYEPTRALDGGDDGLAVVRRVAVAATRVLRPGGWLLVEIGGTQADLLAPDLTGLGYAGIAAWHDEDGDLRGVEAQLGP